MIMLPEDAPLGAHRLRVRSNWNAVSGNPCDTYTYGEAEDYTVVVTAEELTASLYTTVVSSATGEPVEDAAIAVLGSGLEGETNDEGICLMEWIEPGNYDIEIAAFGFEPAFFSDIYLFGNRMHTLEVSLEATPPETHLVNVPAGWSGLSSFIVPANNALENVFASFLYDLIIVQNFGGVFWPQEELNTIGNWENHSAFAIKTGNGFTLPINGYPETNRTFSLDDGWTMLPVICNHNPNTASLFSTVESDLLLVKEIAGTEIYWPAMGINTLPELQLGKAYLVKMQAASVVTFPENMTKSKTVVNLKKPINCELWDNPVTTANSHIIAIPESVWTTAGLSDGDFVGVFTPEGICAGLAQLSGNTSIAVFGDDPLNVNKQGFLSGEPMTFKIYCPTIGEIVEVDAEYNPQMPQTGIYENEGISAITMLKAGATGIDSNAATEHINIFPNPATDDLTITGISTIKHIEITDVAGRIVRSIKHNGETNLKLDLSGLYPGVYQIRMTNENLVVVKKLIKN
jgi:hypothetical protein